MKVSGYGEFQQMRKAIQKDETRRREATDHEETTTHADKADAVSISPEARRKIKLHMASDYRQAKVDNVKARLEAGTLVTEDSLKSSTRKMLGSLFSGEL